jgi:uncharacterized phiE125 gp8 family phage protein
MLISVTPPAGQVITTAEAKARLNLSGTDDDALLTSMILAAQAMLDGRDGQLNRALLTQTWKWTASSFIEIVDDLKTGEIMLPLAPTQSITEIAYFDASSVKQVIPALSYRVAAGGYHGDVITPVLTSQWPYGLETLYRADAVQITFVCGYSGAGAVPEPIKQALFLIVADMYSFRETGQIGSISTAIQNYPTVEALLEPYRARAL